MNVRTCYKFSIVIFLASILLFPPTIPLLQTEDSSVIYAANQTYKVKKGDSLYKISTNNKTTVSNLKKWNNLKNDVIKIGQTLKVSASNTNVSKNNSTKKTVIITAYSLNVRKAASFTAPIVKVAKKGQEFTILKESNGLYQIGTNQWISANTKYVKVKNTTSNEQKVAEKKPATSTPESSIKTYRYQNTNIHVYISEPYAKLQVSKGKEKKNEPLSSIKLPKELVKTNLGFFNTTTEHVGMYFTNNTLHKKPNKKYINLVYLKSGKVDIFQYDKALSQSQLAYLKNNATFAVGTSYSLVQNGKKNLQNSGLFAHANTRNPRTMFGQIWDGRFVIAVTDGRVAGSSGLTASQSADFMLKFGVTEAVNFDGGGSSTMIINGKIKNKLAGGQRSIGSALFITE